MSDTSCWSCAYRRGWGHKTFLGLCTIFEKIGQEPKQIPATRVDMGCSHFVEKTRGA